MLAAVEPVIAALLAAGLLGVGDRYAGTAAACGVILERIVAAPVADRATKALDEVVACRQARQQVPGFGHPIHDQTDPRVERLLGIAREAGVEGSFINALDLLAKSVRKELAKPLVTNISAAIAAVLGEAEIPARMMRGIVLTARCAGLVGHLLEMLRASGAGAELEAAAVPVLPAARELALAGHVPGGTERNRKDSADAVTWGEDVDEVTRLLLCDAQTSGGLLVALSPEEVAPYLASVPGAVEIGHLTDETGQIEIR